MGVDRCRSARAAGVFGPVRYGSQWFVAAQAPIELRSANGSAAASARSVAYENLDALLLRRVSDDW